MSSQEEKVKAAGMDQTLFVSLEEQRSSLSGEEHDYGGGGNDDFLALVSLPLSILIMVDEFPLSACSQ